MISVCIATLNGARFIRSQLLSILPQIGEEDEVIVSDDGSDDETLDIVRGLNDKRIKIIKGPGLHSPTLNFENAIRAASGDFIFLSDQDDVWKPGKLSVCMKWLERYDCVVSDAEIADSRLNVIEESYFKAHGTRASRLYNLLIKNGYMGCCMAFSRRVAAAALPFPAYVPLHDIWIGNVAAYFFSVRFIGDRLVTFRSHGGNSSFTAHMKSGYSLSRRLAFRLSTARGILSIMLKRKAYGHGII